MIECRACGVIKPPGEFYKARGYVDKICRPCKTRYVTARKRMMAQRPGTREVVCTHCGKAYLSNRKVSLFCSRGCKNAARNARAKLARMKAKPHRICEFCSSDMPQSMRATARFCSERCNSAAHQWWRKSAQRAGISRAQARIITRVEIGERDGWICGICGQPVDRRLRYPDPDCASIDHIVPVARGGGHELANLQLSHLSCNVRKRDQVKESA